MVKSRQKLTKGQARKLTTNLSKKLKANPDYIFDGNEQGLDCIKSEKGYYFSISGFAPSGLYYSISIYSFDNIRHTIDYSHNTKGRRYLNALLKAELLKFKK